MIDSALDFDNENENASPAMIRSALWWCRMREMR